MSDVLVANSEIRRLGTRVRRSTSLRSSERAGAAQMRLHLEPKSRPDTKSLVSDVVSCRGRRSLPAACPRHQVFLPSKGLHVPPDGKTGFCRPPTGPLRAIQILKETLGQRVKTIVMPGFNLGCEMNQLWRIPHRVVLLWPERRLPLQRWHR